MFGFLVIDKPSGITSRNALNLLAKQIRPAKVGHAGTLDPLATGILVVCVGPATRLTQFVQKMPKHYTACFRLGFQSPTEDIEGDVTPVEDPPQVTADDLTAALPFFLGTIMQMPPKFSALRVDGKRAYDLARRGADVELKPRPVQIEKLTLTKFDYPDFQLDIVCGSGTYVRSLGRDIGKRLGSNAVMTSLVRTAVGQFQIEQALELADLNPEVCHANLQPAIRALPDLEIVPVTREQTLGFTDGVPLRLDENSRSYSGDLVAVDEQNRLIAVLRRKYAGIFAPSINFAHYWTKFDETQESDR